MARIAIAVALTLAMQGARAADKDGVYAFYWVRNCWDYVVWTSRGNSSEIQSVASWVGGYLTAYNRLVHDTVSILGRMDLSGAMAWVGKWCHENPKNSLGDAMNALTGEFHARRHRTAKDAGG